VYNARPEHLARALSSVRAQTLDDWVCVVVDDGSDRAVRIAAERVPITVVRQENRGVAAARNTGIHASKSEYVAFLDQDDEWLPDKLELQVAFMKDKNLAMADTDFEYVSHHGSRMDGFEYHDGEFLRLLTTARMGLSTLVMRRDAIEAVGGLNEGLIYTSDWDIQLRVAERGMAFDRLRKVLSLIHLHEANASWSYEPMYHEQLAVLRPYRRSVSPAVRQAARAGSRYLRRHYAADALERYRSTHEHASIWWAARQDPVLVGRFAARKVRRRLTLVANRVKESP
jgi:glycosyltransferase involved in cell wall biosynthesis